MGTNLKSDRGRGLIEKLQAFLKDKRKQRILGGILICIGLIAMFNIINDDVNPEDVDTGATLRGHGVKIGIVLAEGGKGDKSFNDSAVIGLEKAKKELGITYKDIEILDNSQNRISLEFLAKEKCDLVIGVGYLIRDYLKETALKYPNINFVLIDSAYEDETPSNVCSMIFKDNEGSYLAGVLAAGTSKTKKVGFIGGMESPLIQRFEGGYKAGVESIPGVQLYTSYVATDGSGFNNLDRGREITFDFISKGVDVVYHVAGTTGQGVFDAAAQKGIKAIGVDSNQNWIKPGVVMASMLKRVDVAVYEACESVVDGTFKGGRTRVFGLSDDGVGLTDLNDLTTEETEGISKVDQAKIQKLKDSIPEKVKKNVLKAKEGIISGEIEVPDWLETGKPKS